MQQTAERNRIAATNTNGTKVPDREFVGLYDGVRFEVWTITPKQAERMLEKVHNRPLTKSRIAKYARVMQKGRWVLNFEWIGLDEFGAVIEGQHRLHACVEAGIPIRALVVIGIPRELFPSLGVSKPRGVADNIALVGKSNAAGVGAALVFLHRVEKGMALYTTGVGSRPENDEALELLARHPGIEDSYVRAARCRRVYPHLGMLAYLHYEFAKRNRDLADAFVAKLAEGTGLKDGDPAHALRERLIDARRPQNRPTQKYVMAITIKAWNYAVAGRRAPKFLRWSEGAGEPFPEIK